MTNNEVVQDFRRRYEGTFVFLNMEEKNIETLVNIRKVEDSSSKIGVLHLDSEEYGTITLNLGSEGHSLKFKYPPVGVFQHKREALYFRRKPARQYRRGICGDNSLLLNTTRNFAGNFVAWSASEIKSAFDHTVFSVADAMKMLESNKARSVALRDNFSVSLSVFESPDYVVWFWGIPVARCNPKGAITRIYEEVFARKLYEQFNK
jgi:hypothetical protein